MGSLSIGALLGNLGGGPFTGNFERQLKDGSGLGVSLSVGVLWGEPGRGLPYWGPWRLCRGRLWRQASFSTRALLWNLEGDSYTRDWKMNAGGLWKQSISLCGSSMRGTWRDGSFTGDPEGYAKALEMGVCFHNGPVLRNMGGLPFLWPFREG